MEAHPVYAAFFNNNNKTEAYNTRHTLPIGKKKKSYQVCGEHSNNVASSDIFFNLNIIKLKGNIELVLV